MDLRRLARELKLTRKDRIGLIVLSFLVLLSIYLPTVAERTSRINSPDADTSWIAAIREMEAGAGQPDSQWASSPRKTHYYPATAQESRPLTPFDFDPNEASAADLERLGLPERTVRTILNFRGKGGKFRVKEDLMKIYGLRPEHFEILQAYVRIPENPHTFQKKDWPSSEKPPRKFDAVEINESDTSAWIALPGIGSRLSQRIILFREKLGGFYSIDQLKEVYGLADSVFQKIRPHLYIGTGNIRTINLNTATEEELRAHPYIRLQLARTVVAYRNTHGNFRTLEELKNIMAITNEVFEKLKPYLVVSPQ